MPHEDADRAEPQSDEWSPPPLDERTDSIYDTPVGDMGDVLRFRLYHDIRDNLVAFAVIQMTRHKERLVNVAVVDIHRNELHVHYYDKNERRIRRESLGRMIQSQKDVDGCYDAAVDWIYENWESSKRRWSRG